MMQKQPPFLNIGDRVAIVASARFVTKNDISLAIAVLTSWGLEVVTSNNLFSQDNQFAGNDETRLKDFQNAIDDPLIKAVFIARGGYGTIRIIDKVNFDHFISNPKWIVGFSDITVLHSHIHSHFNIETLHAAMPLTFSWDEASIKKLRETLFGKKLDYTLTHHPNCTYRTGVSYGQLVGGNLSILYSLQASDSDLQTNDKILFIEDLDEYLYHIDRMLISLFRSGKLNRLKGLIIGGMSDMKDNKVPFGKSANQIIFDSIAHLNFPVTFNFPSGHEKVNMPLVLGREIKLEVKETETIVNFSERH
jgi:muramoyltetrapeptide carboxypeptidase